MRLICTIDDQKKARQFSAFLAKSGIPNQCELATNTDWGSEEYGTIVCRIWILEEDHVETALKWLERFKANPNDSEFTHTKPPPVKEEKAPQDLKPEMMGPATLYILILCALLFALTRFMQPEIQRLPQNIPYLPVYATQIKKTCLYDWPKAYQIMGDIVKTYGIDKLQDPSELPREGKEQLMQFFNTPYWKGLYEKIVQKFQNPGTGWNFDAPLFEKIRQGEIWRLFTPCLLHADIFHLLFNMIWLIVIGKQIENRIGIPRYLLFILLTGIFSNTAQYLVSGANFIGFSGVLCGMIAFVWFRQQSSAWEGYHLQPATAAFILFFVLTMFVIQFAAFIFSITSNSIFSPNIANTAHIAGGILGILLARMRFFAAR